jgi:hypothetical protein
VIGGREPESTIEDGILSVALAEAVYESIRTEKAVYLGRR